MNKWAVDYKGPIMHGNSKYYILACVELNLRLVHFSIAKSLEATETAKLLFEGIIASYGSSIEIISDRGEWYKCDSFLCKCTNSSNGLGG